MLNNKTKIMKMKYLFVFAVVVATALNSCSKDEVFLDKTDGTQMKFGLYSSQIVSKAGDVTSETIKTTGFGVFANYSAGGGNFSNSSSLMNYMYNQEITWSGTDWIYAPVKYWSNNPEDTYSFFAYAPYTDVDATPAATSGITAFSSAQIEGAPVASYTMPANMNDAVDFVAGQLMNTPEVPLVSLNMKHQLTKVGFSVKTNIPATTNKEENQTWVVVRELTVGGSLIMKDGTYIFSSLSTTDEDRTNHQQDGIWFIDTPIDLTFVLDGEAVPAELSGITDYTAQMNYFQNGTNNLKSIGVGYILPPNGTVGVTTAGDVTAKITYDIVTLDSNLDGGYTVAKQEDVALDLGGATSAATLKQGFAYNFIITISLSECVISGNVVGWDSATDSNVEVD